MRIHRDFSSLPASSLLSHFVAFIPSTHMLRPSSRWPLAETYASNQKNVHALFKCHSAYILDSQHEQMPSMSDVRDTRLHSRSVKQSLPCSFILSSIEEVLRF